MTCNPRDNQDYYLKEEIHGARNSIHTMSRYIVQRTNTPIGQMANTTSNSNGESECSHNESEIPASADKKYVKMSMFNRFIGQFDPYNFIFNMGIGMSSDLLYEFPYPARWLRICSYIMFAINVLLFIFQQMMFLMHIVYFSRKYSKREYFNKYFRNVSKNVFWGTYPMGLVTIINYINNLAEHFYSQGRIVVAKRILRLVYVLWWYDIIVSVLIAWGVTFIIWQNYYFQDGLGPYRFKSEKMAAEHMKSVLLLAIIPMVVATSSISIFIMSDLSTLALTRNIQLLSMIIATLIWLHAIIFVFILIGIYFWSLYIFKIPPMSQVFTMFLVLGPMGQGAYGILLLTNNVNKYTQTYYTSTISNNSNNNILLIAVPWCFKIMGLLISMALLSMGYFFTIITIVAIISYSRSKYPGVKGPGKTTRIYHYHQGFWGMTFPMGTMSLGSNEIFNQYNEFVPVGAFRVIGTIYAVVSVLWTLYCLGNTILLYGNRSYNALKTPMECIPEQNEMKLEPIVSDIAPETDFSFMREEEEESSDRDEATTKEAQDHPTSDSTDSARQESKNYPESFERSVSNSMKRTNSASEFGLQSIKPGNSKIL